MLDTMGFIAFIAAVFIGLIIAYVFIYKRNSDVRESSEIKPEIAVTKQGIVQPKKSKKKGPKKGVQTDSDAGSFHEEQNTENEGNEHFTSLLVKETQETVEEVKVVEEFAAPSSKRKKNKGKNVGGDQIVAEAKTVETEKNDNQSNTLLGRGSDDKLKEDILGLQKKIDDLQSEKSKTEISLDKSKKLLNDKEGEIKELNTKLGDLLTKLNDTQHVLHSEKEKLNVTAVDKEKSKKEFEDLKARYEQDSTGHKGMYTKYEDKIEQLKNEIKKHNSDADSLNKQLKDEIEKRNEINKQLEHVTATLKEKSEELKTKGGDIHKLKEVNANLKQSIDELHRKMTAKEADAVKNDNKLKSIIKDLGDKVEKHNGAVDEKTRNETALRGEISALTQNIGELKKDLLNKQECVDKVKTFEADNKQLHDKILSLEAESEKRNHQIELLSMRVEASNELEDTVKQLQMKEGDASARYAAIEQQRSELREVIEQLQTVLDDKEEELIKVKSDSATVLEYLDSLKSVVVGLKEEIVSKEAEANTMVGERDARIKEQQALIDSLGKITADKDGEIELLKRSGESMSRTLDVQRTKEFEDLRASKTHLEIILHDLKQESLTKTSEIEDLRMSNGQLLQQVSLITGEMEGLRAGVSVEEIIPRQSVAVEMSQMVASSDEMGRLADELTELRFVLDQKETQVENLIQHTSTLANDNKTWEKRFAANTGDWEARVSRLTEENRRLVAGGAGEAAGPRGTEVDGLRSHVKKLEKELLEMQGRYHTLKEDSINLGDKEKHHNRNVHSELHVVSIPPSCEEPHPSSHPDDDNSSTAHGSLQAAIDRLNSEIAEQRRTNQELQASCSLSQQEKAVMRGRHEALATEHEVLRRKYADLEGQWAQLNVAVHADSNGHDDHLDDKMTILREENGGLRSQLEQYRGSLEKTERMLEKIQCSVDKEETVWRVALRSSEDECGMLENKVRALSAEVEELKASHTTEDVETTDDNTVATSLKNGLPSSDCKKKRKRKNKNKKKKNKNRVSESNGL